MPRVAGLAAGVIRRERGGTDGSGRCRITPAANPTYWLASTDAHARCGRASANSTYRLRRIPQAAPARGPGGPRISVTPSRPHRLRRTLDDHFHPHSSRYPCAVGGIGSIEVGDIWCRLSGDWDQKSHMAVGLRGLVPGSRFWVSMKSGNLYGSRTKNTGVLLPTRSQLPSSVAFGGRRSRHGSARAEGRGRTRFTQTARTADGRLSRIVCARYSRSIVLG